MLIQTKDLKKIYTTEEVETTALNNIDLTIDQGEYVAIMGPSGCGKSTLLNILGLIDNPTSGQYWFLGKDVADSSELKRAGLRKSNIGFIFQSFYLIDELTVFENVELPLLYLGYSAGKRKKRGNEVLENMALTRLDRYTRRGGLRLDWTAVRADVEQGMHSLGFSFSLFGPARSLSGGNQQRMVIVRELSSEPKLVVASYVTRGLDVQSATAARQARSGNAPAAAAEGIANLLRLGADLEPRPQRDRRARLEGEHGEAVRQAGERLVESRTQ